MRRQVAARLARTARDFGWPFYDITAERGVYLAGVTVSRLFKYEVPWTAICIAESKPRSSGLKFAVYSLGVEEGVSVVWYRAKRER